jgi:hypothetical protein
MRTFLPKGRILIVIGLILLILVFLVMLTIRGGGQKGKTSPSPSPTNPFVNLPVDDTQFIKSPMVVNITPDDNSILTPGEIQTFSVKFNSPIAKESMYVFFRAKDNIEEENYKAVEFSQTLSENNTLLSIKTVSPILVFHNYNLTIYQANGAKLLQVTYTSDRFERTKEPQNNPELAKYLPHETSSYTLSYIENLNLYIFSFNYNAESEESLDSQYEKAKQDAERFIESKGIDLNSIKIEWRFH